MALAAIVFSSAVPIAPPSCDGVTFVALAKLEDGGSHSLRELPAYAKMVQDLQQWYAEPPAVEQMTVTGSYGLF